MTVCVLALEEDQAFERCFTRMGISFCHRNDQYSKRAGREESLRRAVEEPITVAIRRPDPHRNNFDEYCVYLDRAVSRRDFQRGKMLQEASSILAGALPPSSGNPSWLQKAPSWAYGLADSQLWKFDGRIARRKPLSPPFVPPAKKEGIISKALRLFFGGGG